jgi:hypothetical protein
MRSPRPAAAISFARTRHLPALPYATVLHGTAETELQPLGFRLLAQILLPACHWQTRSPATAAISFMHAPPSRITHHTPPTPATIPRCSQPPFPLHAPNPPLTYFILFFEIIFLFPITLSS